MDTETILNATQAIRRILSESRSGKNLTAKQEADREIGTIRSAIEGNYLREKVGNLSSRIEILYGAQKHEHYGGVDSVKNEVREILSKIDNFVKQGRTT